MKKEEKEEGLKEKQRMRRRKRTCRRKITFRFMIRRKREDDKEGEI